MITPQTAVKVTIISALTVMGALIAGTWGAANAFKSKTDAAEMKEAWGQIGIKANQVDVAALDRRIWLAETEAKLAAQRQEWLLQDIKKANEKLDFLITELITSRRKGGEGSANSGSSGSTRPGEGSGTKSSPTPDSISSSPGPNPLSGQ
jgi:hypothetical protein